jgi:hypothetical protein
MTVFITHAAADRPIAEALEKFLERRGVFAELEDGSRGFRPLGARDCLVALWSKEAVFSPHRLPLERRSLDAWADGKLAMVKLDQSFAPVGLRDLRAIDASFEPQRDIAWAAVAKFAQDQTKGAAAEDTLPQSLPSPRRSRVEIQWEDDFEIFKFEVKKSTYRGPLEISILCGLLAMLVAAGAGFGLLHQFFLPDLPQPGLGIPSLETLPLLPTIAGAGLVVLLVFVFEILRLLGCRRAVALEATTASQDPAAAPTGPPLFISYASGDRIVVNRVCEAIERQGRAILIDKAGIQAGEGWAGEIVRAIKAASTVAIMCSTKAFESDHVKRELYLADRYKKPLLPILLEPAAMPEEFEFFFAGVQWVDLHQLKGPEREAAIARAVQNVP